MSRLAEPPIDLRSDTVTRPCAGMRQAMADAEVGDDVYGEDPSVLALQERVADLLGHQAALFTPTGSLANVLAVRSLVGVGQEVLCESSAHIARAELGAHGAITGITMRTWTGPVDVSAIESIFAPDLGPFLVPTAAVSVENTHNFRGGEVADLTSLKTVKDFAVRLGVGVHLDGARLWNAHVATGVPLNEYGATADVVSVCLSKGLGAPVGSLVVGGQEMIEDARVWRKRLGGGMRQVGVLAAAGLHALDHHLQDLDLDHERARRLAAAVGVEPSSVDTNIVVLPHPRAAELVSQAQQAGVLISLVGPHVARLVTHRDLDDSAVGLAESILGRIMETHS